MRSELVFGDVFRTLPKERRASIALAEGAEALTYAELEAQVQAASAALLKCGIREYDCVGLQYHSASRLLIMLFALSQIGAAACILNAELDPKAIAAQEKLTHLARVFSDADDLKIDTADSFSKENSAGNARRTALILYTKGEFEEPRAVELSQYALLNLAAYVGETLDGCFGERLALLDPMGNGRTLLMALAALLRGGTVILPPKSQPLSDWYRAAKADTLAGSIDRFEALMKAMKGQEAEFLKPKLCLVSGTASTQARMTRMEATFLNAAVINLYGQTEASGLISMTRPTDGEKVRLESVGRVIDGVSIKISDPEIGALQAGEIGEICVRGYNLCNGYYRDPYAKKRIDAEGWLHTNDLGYLDQDGYLYLAGKIHKVIQKNGTFISPLEVEQAIAEFDAVREVKVFGAMHPIYGESVEACLVANEKEFHENELRSALRRRLGGDKVPSHFLLFDQFPRSERGGLDEKRLQREMMARLKLDYIADTLGDGLVNSRLCVVNSVYNIVPTADYIAALAANVGFLKKRQNAIHLAVEEMLTERVVNAYQDVGDIHIEVILQKNWMRIRFFDEGEPYQIRRDQESSLSARMILNLVDNYQQLEQDGKRYYCMDFLYESDFDIHSFMLAHTKDPEEKQEQVLYHASSL